MLYSETNPNMGKQSLARSCSKVFSLVELLVVVSILAILMSMLMPSLKRTLWVSTNLICINNLKQNSSTLVLFSEDHNDYWPYRGSSMTEDFNAFKRVSSKKQEEWRENTYENPMAGGDFDLVWQLAEYDPIEIDRGKTKHGSEEVYNTNEHSQTMGPSWVCPLYSGSNEGINPYGCDEHGVACAKFIDGNKGYMSYDLFVSGGADAERRQGAKRINDLIDFGRDWPKGGDMELPLLLNSNLLLADRAAWGWGDYKDNPIHKNRPIRVHHQPKTGGWFQEGDTTGLFKARYSTRGDFTQNYATTDGSVTTANSDWVNVVEEKTHGRLWFSTLVPLDAGERP